MRRTYQCILLDKWEWGVCGVESQRRQTQPPCTGYDGQGVQGTDRISVFANTKPRQLSTEHGYRIRTSVRNWKVLTQPSDVSKIHCRGRSLEKVDCRSGVTSLPIPTDGSDHMVQTGVITYHAATYILHIRSNPRNWYQGERGEDDGPYDPVEPLDPIIEQLEKGREFSIAWGQTISDAMMMSKESPS